MDGVSYDRGVSNERLMDPACGSGTFLVEAVERYLKDVERYATDEPDWEERLRELCTQPRMVGLDIHPFAVLMAQIRFVVAILPEYRKAKEQNQHFTLRRLPIYRTDTLRNERELTGADLGDEDTWQMTWDAMTENEQDVLIPVPLPIEVDEEEVSETEDGFLVRRVRMPLFDTIKLNTGVRNFGEYFAALQGVLDTVKDHIAAAEGELGSDFDWTYRSGLEKNVNRYTSQEYDGVEEFFEPYVDDMLENVRYLKEEHNDGRLFKMLEDAVLSLVVKNYMDYEYVVGNPPYVSVQNIPKNQKSYLNELYSTADQQYDLYCPFYERGVDWLTDGGKLGYITPNQFLVTDYGEELRKLMLSECAVEEIFDFRDSRVFKDATNYPAICILEREEDDNNRDQNGIRCIRIRSDIDPETGRELDAGVIDLVRSHRDEPGYSDAFIDVFDYPQSDLSSGIWALMPPEERDVFTKIRDADHGTTIGDVTDAVFDGPTTGANGVFVVDVLDAEKVDASTEKDTVRIQPTGDEDAEYEIEAELLRPWLQGRDVNRWRPAWSGRHVILPYKIDTDAGEKTVHSPETMENKYPLAADYFQQYEDTLRRREGGKWKDSDTYWELSYPRNLPRFELPKLVFAEFANEPTYLIDEGGEWYFKSAYAVQLAEEYHKNTKEVACQLNSSTLEFYFKHIATVKAGGYYAFRSQYVEPLPCVVDIESTAGKSTETKIRSLLDQIGEVLDLENKTDRFPEAYLGDYDGDLDYITYEWQTRRYPVNAEVQGEVDGEFTVQAGRSDTITDPAMYADDRDARKLRAQYVYEAVDGRNVKSGEETTIPIPKTDRGVEELLTNLKADEETVGKTDIEELEAKIDAAVYDLFDLTKEEQEVIEDYLEVF